MSFKDQYQRMNDNIKPDEQTVSGTLARMKDGRKHTYRIFAGIAAAACAAVVIVLAAAGVFSAPMPGQDISAALQTPAQTAADNRPTVSSVPTPTAVLIAPDGSPVDFSDLGLDLPDVDYPDVAQSLADIAAFSEDMIADSSMIVDGTVKCVRFNHYFDDETTAVYEVRVNNVLYAKTDVAAGDLVLIEQSLYEMTSLQDSIIGLKPGGRYILPIAETPAQYAYATHFVWEPKVFFDPGADPDADVWDYIAKDAQVRGITITKAQRLESAYTIIYPFMPPIQVVPGVGYMFPNSWESLLTDDASPVEMDTDSDALYFTLHLRDEGFLDDFGRLIDTYTSEAYQTEHNRPKDVSIENGRIQTTKNLAYLYVQKQLGSFIMEDINAVSREEQQRILAAAQAEPYPIVISDIVLTQDDSGAWTASFGELVDGQYQPRRIEIPASIALPDEAQLVAEAHRYLQPAYQALDASVHLDESMMVYHVDFVEADGDVLISADLNFVGSIVRYTVFV